MGDLIGIVVIVLIAWIGLKDLLIGRAARISPSSPKPTAPPVPRGAPSPKQTKPQPVKAVLRLEDLPEDIARAIRSLPDRSLDQLLRQWSNVIGQIDRAGPSKVAALIAFRTALTDEWARRLAIAEADPRAFPWPTTKAPKGKSGLDSGNWHLIGMLSYLGYRVGATAGVSVGIRHQILDICFDAPLPPINGMDYMRSWGPPGTTVRLRKLANELASFARNGKRKRNANLSNAVADWEADLKYLYQHYYVGRFRFSWPRFD